MNMNIWVDGSSNYLYEVLILKQNAQKNKLVTGKMPFFVKVPFCTPHSIYLRIGF